MPILPLIDFMLLAGWTSFLVGFVLKVVYLLTNYRPTLFSLTPIDFLLVGLAAMIFAIALAARTWVAGQTPARSAARRRDATMEAYRALQDREGGAVETAGAEPMGAPEALASTEAGSRVS